MQPNTKQLPNSANQLDYSAIPKQQRWSTLRYLVVGLGLSALTSIFIGMLGGFVAGSSAEGFFGSIAILIVDVNTILVVPLIFATVVSGIVILLTTKDFIGKYIPIFAAANGFVAQLNTYNINKDGSIFSIGDSPKEKNIITGNYRGYNFELYEHSYMTGSGKNRTQHRLSILNIQLPNKVPQMVIDSKLEDATAYSGSVLPVIYTRDQKLTLEGDFSKYFDVYCPKDYQVSALSLLTPDVMQTFLTRLNQVDVELVNDRLYIYDPDVMNSAEQLADMFEAADAIIDEWSAKLKRANIYASKKQEQIHIGENPQPVHLRRGGVLAAVIVVGLVLLINVLRVTAEVTNNIWISFPVFMILPVALVLVIINQIIVARRRTAFTKRYGKIND